MEHDSRQAIDDMTPINNITGLPKHVYEYNHAECTYPAFRGTFQMKGKKIHTARFPYDPSKPFSKTKALRECVTALKRRKREVGWFKWVAEKGYHGDRGTTGVITPETSYNARYKLKEGAMQAYLPMNGVIRWKLSE